MKRRIIIMGLITTILNLFGCSGQTKKDDRKLSKADEDQLAKSIDAFKNRPIYKELTGQVIDTTSDDNLLQIVFDNLSEKQTDNYEKEFEAVMSWNKSRQAEMV